ncbi:TRAPP II complex, Trs65 [Phaffia rhodozyma]|uniref:TRAPP II complex, Trs65 n=1 Tax=Phaffia rhodozyma TaxID=264483 RepID=A0A0F7SQZ6_PHARH|nr:TRAPP II complex, Trs65 [Phaffia rhodozyma]
MSFSRFFHAATLGIHVPEQPLSVPRLTADSTAEDRSAWVHQALGIHQKRLAFYDEQLSVYLSITLNDIPVAEDEHRPSQELLLFLSHLQITLESSYVSHLPASPSPSPQHTATFASNSSYFPAAPTSSSSSPGPILASSTPISLGVPPNASNRRSFPGTPTEAGFGNVLSTPFPTPGVGSLEEKRYARSEGVQAWSTIWGHESANHERKWVGLSKNEKGSWVAVWELQAPVAFMKTRIQDPLFCLTASITLRDKPAGDIIQGYPSASSENTMEGVSHLGQDIHDNLEDIDLLGGLGEGYSFPSTRLSSKQIRPSHAVANSVSFPEGLHQGPKVIPPVSLIDLPTLRKSFRAIFALASGLSLRMRTVYLPNLLTNAGQLEGQDLPDRTSEDEEGDEEERKIVMSVEVESTGGVTDEGDNSCGFEIETVEVLVGGGSSGVHLLEPFSSETPECRDSVEKEAAKSVFPLELRPLDQFSLLYVVSTTHLEGLSTGSSTAISSGQSGPTLFPPGPTDPTHHRRQTSIVPAILSVVSPERPVSIAVTGRPFIFRSSAPSMDLPSTESEKHYLSSSFVSRWNCSLDLTHLDTGLVNKRISVPALAGLAQPRGIGLGRPSVGLGGGGHQVAGNRRYSIANLASLAQSGRNHSSSSHNPNQLQQHHPALPSINSLPTILPTPPQAFPPIQQIDTSLASGSASINGMKEPLATPAFPSYPAHDRQQRQPSGILPPSQLAFVNSRTSAPAVSTAEGGGRGGHGTQYEEEGLLVSVNVHTPYGASSDRNHGENGEEARDEERRDRRTVRPLEPFTLEVFVFNKSDRIRRFVVGVPEKRRGRLAGPAEVQGHSGETGGDGDVEDGRMGISQLRSRLAEHLSSTTPLIPLENNIRVGPLLPRSSQSVRMKFLALTEGVHSVDTLAIIGIGDSFAVNLKSVCNIIVRR